MDLEIRKDERSKGLYHQKGIWNREVSKTRLMASKDITKECGKNKFYTVNYLPKEYLILQLKKYWIEIIPI